MPCLTQQPPAIEWKWTQTEEFGLSPPALWSSTSAERSAQKVMAAEWSRVPADCTFYEALISVISPNLLLSDHKWKSTFTSVLWCKIPKVCPGISTFYSFPHHFGEKYYTFNMKSIAEFYKWIWLYIKIIIFSLKILSTLNFKQHRKEEEVFFCFVFTDFKAPKSFYSEQLGHFNALMQK